MKVHSLKFLSAGVFLLISTLVVNGAASREAAIVKDVSFSNSGDSLEAKIASSGETKFTYFELKSPHRLVVDFHGIQNTISFKEKKVGVAGLDRVRTSFFSDHSRKATRIVFDLDDNVLYRVIDDGDGNVRIVFGPTAHAPSNLTAGPPVAPPAESPELPAVIIEPSAPPITVPERLLVKEEPAISPLPTIAAAALEPIQPSVAIEPPPPPPPVAPPIPAAAATTTTPAPSATAVLTSSPAFRATENALLPQTQVTIVPPTPSQVPSITPTPTPQYQGEIITIDLKDSDIKEFFRFISEFTGLNVVLDPGVMGTIPVLRLTDVPWDQALDVVLKNFQLGAQLQGNVLRVATNATLQAELAAQKAAKDALEQQTPLLTRNFILNYTKADAVATTLKSAQLLTMRGTIVVDARRNALIISDIPGQFDKFDAMVKFLDTPAQQVEIEARLLQANKSFSKDIGNQIGFLVGAKAGNVLTGLPSQVSPFNRTPQPRATSGAGLPLISNFPAAATSGLSFLIQPGGDILLDEIIGAAEASGTARLISRPRVTTQNNMAATIQQGTQIPVQTNVNNTITVQFTSFTLNLTVTPQITEAGTILLTVQINNSQPDFAKAVNGIPSVATQQATTQVLIPDGGTAVIGGILVDTDTVNVRQVPGFGNLPVIGTLFKNTNTVKQTSELIFFITPRIKAMDAITVLAPGEEKTPAQPQQR